MHPLEREPLSSNSIQMDTRLSDLLSPIRDPTKNWEVNIAATLEEYLSKLEGLHLTFNNGCLSLNFAQAALIIQGSTSVYCKKVEYLCSLCQQVLHIISSERRAQPQTSEASKENSEVCKEKDTAFVSSTCDDFCSLDDLKIQKGLDLVEDDYNCSNKKTLPLTPVMLIRLDEREKGHIMLLNCKGEVVGNKQDYHLNICELDDSGALLFPMPSSEFTAGSTIPDFFNIPSGSESDDDNDADNDFDEDSDGDHSVSRHKSYSPCPSNFDVPTEKDNVSITIAKDKSDVAIEKDNLNTSKEKDKSKSDVRIEKVSCKPQRKSLRHEAIKAKRAAVEKQKLDSAKNKKQERSTSATPKKRKATKQSPVKPKGNAEKSAEPSRSLKPPYIIRLNPVEGFSCEAFYSPKTKIPKVALNMPLVDTFGDLFWGKTPNGQDDAKEQTVNESAQDTVQEISENVEEAKLSDEDDNGCPFPGADDYDDDSPDVDQNNGSESVSQHLQSSCESDKDGCPEVSSSEELTHKNVESYLNSVAHYCRTDDLTKKVNEWEDRIKPILRMESRRETFDIRAYEGRVMKNFDNNSKKQAKRTVSFSKICKGKQKWEVCRYFLASLQLANKYNVDISTNDPAKGSDMELTLVS